MSNFPGGGRVRAAVSASGTTIEGGPALPVYGYKAATIGTLAVDGGPALPVKVLTAADLVQNGGKYWLEGDPQAVPMILVTDGRAVEGRAAVPVYVVGGAL